MAWRAGEPADRSGPMAHSRVTFEVSPDRATASGFDHSAAFMLFIYALTLDCVAVAYVIAYRGWRIGLASGAAAIVASLALGQLFRFHLAIHPTEIVLTRRWLGVPYKRLRCDVGTSRFRVWGTGDYGDEGDWPAQRYCELEPDGRSNQDICLGSPSNAEALCEFLTAQAARLSPVGGGRNPA
jgi:hypothetical protein